LIVVLVVVGALVALSWPRGTRQDGVHVVDVTRPIAAAKQDAGFPLLSPVGLSHRWRPTSTQFTAAGPSSGASFRIGYVTPASQYAEFLESNDAPEAVAAQYGPLTVDGTATVNGSAWQQYRTNNNRILLRKTIGSVTVIVTGAASTGELVELASSLR
jgi:hypothetical protein